METEENNWSFTTASQSTGNSILIKAFKHDDFVLCHDSKLLKDADQWYQSRVVYSGP